MTIDRDALRRLCEAATPGPWTNRIGVGSCDYIVKVERSSDADFVAAARTAIPELLDECEKLRGLLALQKFSDGEVEEILADAEDDCATAVALESDLAHTRKALEEARAEVQRLSAIEAHSRGSTQLVNDIIHEREQARAELEKYKKAVAEHLRFDMASVLTGTPEERLRLEGETMKVEVERLRDNLETAWGLIANAGGGNWEKESPEWREAAARWRDEWFAKIRTAIDAVEAREGK